MTYRLVREAFYDLIAHRWSDLAKRFGIETKAVKEKETVGIIGDYDADGITGTAQLVRYFRRNEMEPVIILPHRERDGYGVKKGFVDTMKAQEVTLLITVDTGIGYPQEIAYARSEGMDAIVTDHHAYLEIERHETAKWIDKR